MRHVLALQSRHERELRAHLFPGDGLENVAYVLCKRAQALADPWTGEPLLQLLSREVVLVDAADIIERSAGHVSFKAETFHRLLPRCNEGDLVAVLAHSHPDGIPNPSAQDDKNEPALFDYGWVRDGDEAPFGSIVMTTSTIRGRVWYGWSKDPFPLGSIRVPGDRFQFHAGENAALTNPAFARQQLAFGEALEQQLRALRVVVIGAGGTGSAVSTLLARLGIGRLAVIDPDIVDVTNLNRLHGARQADADAGRSKVDVVVREVSEMGLGVQVRGFPKYLDDPVCQDVLKSADIVFGCTDDHDGRLLLNRFAYYYCTPVIDLGLVAEPTKEDGKTGLSHLDGRVTTLYPGATCLVCRNVPDSEAAAEELLKRKEPGRYTRLKAEGYIRGGGNPRPAVVTFTTGTAVMAVNEMLHRLAAYKVRSGDHRIHDFLDETDLNLAPMQNANCKFCGTQAFASKGDSLRFLDRG